MARPQDCGLEEVKWPHNHMHGAAKRFTDHRVVVGEGEHVVNVPMHQAQASRSGAWQRAPQGFDRVGIPGAVDERRAFPIEPCGQRGQLRSGEQESKGAEGPAAGHASAR